MWIITKDNLNDKGVPLNRVGTRSNNFGEERFTDTIPIRLLDDDGEVYYEGLATRKRILDSSEEHAFEPLDWAMADAGCTELQYFDNNEWQTL